MQLYIQFGARMMDLAFALMERWGGGGAILSPRDNNESQLVRIGARLRDLKSEVLVDPQCFVRDSDHQRLTQHPYWAAYKDCSTADMNGGVGIRAFLEPLAQLNAAASATRIILPGLLAKPVTREWIGLHERIAVEGAAIFGTNHTISTVALSEDAMKHEDEIEALVDHVGRWPSEGVYLVCETPGPYLVADPGWLANLLILASGLRLAGKEVLVGYCHHQMLALAAANVQGIASGAWLNVRAFPPEKFYERDEDDISRRSTWYYCPQALSEYKLEFLNTAKRHGVLEAMRPSTTSPFADALFSGVDPASVKWGESTAFSHYLTSLRDQSVAATAGSFNAAVAQHNAQLDTAEALLKELRKKAVRGQDRDFYEYVDVNRAALVTLEMARGSRLRRSW